MRLKRIIITAVIILCLIVLAMGIFGAFDNERLGVTEYNVKSERLPESFSGFRITQVSDFHNPESKELVDKTVNAIKNSNPDIIVITGDLIDSRNTRVDIALDFIREISSVAPVYFISGNHEQRLDDYDGFRMQLEEIGVTALENECEIIEKNGEIINLIGLKDVGFNEQADLKGKYLLLDWIDAIDYDKKNYTVVLSHRPEYHLAFSDEKIDLALTGHAHGGQIRFPLIGGIYAPGQGLFPKYDGGLYELSETTAMIVSRGIGNSAYPVRVNNPPEVVVITLEK